MDMSSLMEKMAEFVKGPAGQPGFEPRNAHQAAMAGLAPRINETHTRPQE